MILPVKIASKFESGEYSPIIYHFSITNSIKIDIDSLNGEFKKTVFIRS